MNQELTYHWFNKVFEEQAALYDDAIFDQTEWVIWETLSAWAGEVGYNKTEFAYHLARTDKTQSAARVQFKYGGTRGVFGTPQTYINGVLVSSNPTWTLDDWKKIIDPLISGNSSDSTAQLQKERMTHERKTIVIS